MDDEIIRRAAQARLPQQGPPMVQHQPVPHAVSWILTELTTTDAEGKVSQQKAIAQFISDPTMLGGHKVVYYDIEYAERMVEEIQMCIRTARTGIVVAKQMPQNGDGHGGLAGIRGV